MQRPAGGIVDVLIGLPPRQPKAHSAPYMFKDVPMESMTERSGEALIEAMDAHGIAMGIVPVEADDEETLAIVRNYPDRLRISVGVDPNQAMEGLRTLERIHGEGGVVAAHFMPSIFNPPVPIDDRLAYLVYAKCIELDIPAMVNGGVPGPRVPMESQYVGLVDRVAYTFPELRFVFRHGCEPWEDLAVKMMLKWPNVYYATTGFAPKYYPKAVIDFANSRGSDKVIYGGYYPWGLSLERILGEMEDVPFSETAWPKFLGDNARRVFKLPE